ncbi:fibronectin type III domain-containing protein [Spirochaeta thermophila]|uniref:Fibronectin type III domain protein n=1 Tax=Winmispira thermophila (strain ATCC 49972 / DSM 6192 / RI 19.B1) TaxID=665571 RepID=E0RRM8_WINT6|nr:LamG-like jellyroll fold domain-containing protein [Spirochaeta thermophila]ADN03132.1 fibronectin type III domain protein [Spirochaeta thermophila DSM 6192]
MRIRSVLFLSVGLLGAAAETWSMEEILRLGSEAMPWNTLLGEAHRVELTTAEIQGQLRVTGVTLSTCEAPPEDAHLFLSFENGVVEDITGHFEVRTDLTPREVFAPEGTYALAVEQGKSLRLFTRKETIFSPGKEWGPSTIQFWVKTAFFQDQGVLFNWTGLDASRGVPQQIVCRMEERHIGWSFINVFKDPDGSLHSLSLTSRSILLPDRWYFVQITYDPATGILILLIDGKIEAVTHATPSRDEETPPFQLSLGEISQEPIRMGEGFTGFLDAVAVLPRAVGPSPFFPTRHLEGSFTTVPVDLGFHGSLVTRIEVEADTPEGTAVGLRYRTAQAPHELQDSPWRPLPSRDVKTETRFIQFSVTLFSDDPIRLPHLRAIHIHYEPDTPPPPPAKLGGEPVEGGVRLFWSPVREEDVAGYRIYYGTRPGFYFGREDESHEVPIDAGNVTEYTITGLRPGRMYYFSITTYDRSVPPHESEFSYEIGVRAGGF